MMKKAVIFVCCIAFAAQISAIHVIIIESQTSAFWAVQDTIWKNNAEALGYTAEVVPQSALDDLNNLSSADILVVSSGILTFLSPDHLTTVVDFVIGGRSAYIQSEYQTTYQGNITFQAVMDAANADFAWTSGVSGQLVPMTILGELATTPNEVATLNYFNYGYAGEGEDVVPIMEFQGNNLGFCYADPLSNYGTVITISDEDWAWNNSSPALMQNILYKLVQGTNFIANPSEKIEVAVYPNPFSNETTIRFSASAGNSRITVIDGMGKMVRDFVNVAAGMCILDRRGLTAGMYEIHVHSNDNSVKGSTLVIVN